MELQIRGVSKAYPNGIRSGRQAITVTVPRKPSDAGIDPWVVLIDLERFDNVEKVEIER
jgi:hypothetical protein